MRVIENECVGCDHCINCGRDRVVRYCCDNCESETTLYEYDGKQLCIDCIEETLEKVDGSY